MVQLEMERRVGLYFAGFCWYTYHLIFPVNDFGIFCIALVWEAIEGPLGIAISICNYGVLCRASKGSIPCLATGPSIHGQCWRITSSVIGH